jgi:hypothetical protein
MTALQLSFEAEGLDPHALAALSAPERGNLYRELGLDPMQRACAEEATRKVLAREYGRAA